MLDNSAIASLFEPEPARWGLRGDPYLWREMAQYLRDLPFPASSGQLVSQLELAFESLTNTPMAFSGAIRIARHAHGGISSGHISSDFWRNEALPLLLSRYDKAIAAQLTARP